MHHDLRNACTTGPAYAIGNQNRAGDVSLIVFLPGPHIQDDAAFLTVHELFGFFRCDVQKYHPKK